jgi:hypothetical protein
MNILRDAFSWISLYLVATFFFLSANVFALFMVFNAPNLKDTLKEQGTYDKIVPAVLSTATYSPEAVGQLPLNEPWVKDATQKAFPASDLEQKGNTAIDGTFNWLEGKTDKPGFTLDFTNNKQNLGTEIGKATENRLAALPRCGLNNFPDSIDAFKLSCLPPGYSASALGSQVSSDIVKDQTFLKNPVISSDKFTFNPETTANKVNPLDQLSGLRTFYQHRQLYMWLLPFLTVFCAVLGYFLATNRYRALKRLTRSFMASGVGLLIFALFLGFGIDHITKLAAGDTVTKEIAGPLLRDLAHQARMIYLVFAVIGIVLAIIISLLRRKFVQAKPGLPLPR